MLHHLEPPGPVVVHVVAPVIDLGVDAFTAHNVFQPPGAFQQRAFPSTLTADDQDLAVVVHIDVVVVIGHIGQIQVGAVLIHQVITVAREELLVIIQAGNGEYTAEQVRTAEKQDCRVHGAHGR